MSHHGDLNNANITLNCDGFVLPDPLNRPASSLEAWIIRIAEVFADALKRDIAPSIMPSLYGHPSAARSKDVSHDLDAGNQCRCQGDLLKLA